MAQGKPEGQVYVMVSDLGGLAKIGWSKDPNSRRSALRGATGLSDLRLAWSHNGSRIDERTMHLQFGPMRVFGEWFQYGPPLRELVRGLPVTSRITSYPSVTPYGQWVISRLVGKRAARRRAIPVAWDLYARLKYLAAKRSRASKSVVPVQDVTDEVIRAGLEALGEWMEYELDEMGLPAEMLVRLMLRQSSHRMTDRYARADREWFRREIQRSMATEPDTEEGGRS